MPRRLRRRGAGLERVRFGPNGFFSACVTALRAQVLRPQYPGALELANRGSSSRTLPPRDKGMGLVETQYKTKHNDTNNEK